ncbi:unnamed protein product [Rotaria magnacalcarata]|uniref:Uncharacterized protein n=1 Tax=Rotaria magnacalcarata TaxID=392030 RepID=A0A815AA14_9BILA|nr:unnamed protein product [Rotaria magnacalcarata]CAF2091799.1 unnamed protein product [Rotaria magnacalcarata]CAF4032190.1 unnamed protein product [Rotaria magnacalcarata]CAF4677109.1 unnamed protein product [Rotaria magnacalcarata]
MSNENIKRQRSTLSRKRKSLNDATNNQSSIPRNSNQVVTCHASKHRNKNVNDEFTNEDKRHHHHHNYSVSSTKEYVDQEFGVIDNTFKKLERTTYFQGIGNRTIINNQNSYLP